MQRWADRPTKPAAAQKSLRAEYAVKLARSPGLPPLARSVSLSCQMTSRLSAGEAARALHLSEHTVRSTLKLIYAKLGVSKQSELGG